ncbi:hypothetical protein F0U60_51515 [Archangium minus]|uniref:Uncharacterized protein n=1 Tax=Archangium minus TaxID=83450 RepID=A0ABY9XC85_9BACT|nr:hypothetical protein F0U60_51515 [Archangium minus]
MLHNRSHPPASFTYASTLRLPPLLTQANTSTAKVLRRRPAQSTRALRSFLFSCLSAAWGATLASSSPAWGPEMAAVARLERRRRGTL